ncbi:MAG TPA: peptidylprolyl isomerase [Actinomycetes bacterium]|nr:peptidylprolyl isomerase [Actinomycetes bacterium]
MSPSSQQARRAAARRRYERYQERQARKHRRRHLLQRVGIGVVVLAVVAGVGFWGYSSFLSGDDQPSPEALPSPSVSQAQGCTEATVVPIADPQQFEAPKQVLGKGPATLTLATNCGDIVIELDTKKAPDNANSLAFLAEKGYFDATGCHRLTTSGLFVLQCGDPTYTGSGGPGYTVPDENVPPDGKYPAGVVAMAEPGGGQAGSQFFIVYEDTTLPPAYTVVGRVTQGLPAVKRVAQVGTAGGAPDGEPVQKVVIESATVG